MKKTLLLCFCLLGIILNTSAQELEHSHRFNRKIEFPNIPGYRTLKCDFHMHTVFSDGNVWPSIRTQEAVKDGLDAISLTEHLEYQPHKDDIPHPDRNRAHNIAENSVSPEDLLVVRGAEITRSMPPGHCNAIFIQDANLLMDKDPLTVFREAKRQDAFVFWNHPNWTSQRPDGISKLDSMHHQLIDEGLLHGIEVVNDVTYSEEAFQLALDYNLTIMGTSDIHGLVDWAYEIPSGGHRPITLVMATERSPAAIKEALEAGRTVVWFNNLLLGKEAYLQPLVQSSLEVTGAAYQGKTIIAEIKINNSSDADLHLFNLTDFTFHAHSDLITLEAQSETTISVKTLEKLENFELKFQVLNALKAPKQHIEIILPIKIEEN